MAKRIIQLRKQIRCSARHNTFYRVLSGGRAGLGEVANDLALMAFVFRVDRGTKRNHRHHNRYYASTGIASKHAIFSEIHQFTISPPMMV
jgi:hypothetical protein